MIRFTASRRALLDQCAYPFREGTPTVYDPPGAPALLGTWVHSLIEQKLTGHGVGMLPPKDMSESDAAAGIAIFKQFEEWYPAWVERMGLRDIRVEVPFAYNVATGKARELQSNGHRDYSQATADEITGTVDFLARGPDGAVVLRDWKSRNRDNFYDLRDASPQLRTLALFVARAWDDVEIVDVGAVHIAIHGVEEKASLIDALDLDSDEMALAERIRSIPTATPQTGQSCRFCAARKECPALNQPSGETALAMLDRPGTLTPQIVATAYTQIRVIEERVAAAKARIKQEVERCGPISLGGGRELAITEMERENVSKASITRALGKEDGEALIDRLRSVGALSVSTVRQMQERKQKGT